MIDLGLSKLAVIGVVALIVIGPERLPKVARMAGSLFGRAQRYISEVKAEVSREIELEELRKMQQDVQAAASNVEQSIAKNLSGLEAEMDPNMNWGATVSGGSGPSNCLFNNINNVNKRKSFRKKKLARTSAIPSWYKQQNGHKTRVMSGAARMAKYRPGNSARKLAPFFPQ